MSNRVHYFLSSLDVTTFYQRHLQNCTVENIRGNWCNSGLCPFHDDRKTGSFGFNIKNGAFNCFACEGGSIIDFVTKFYDVGYKDAIRILKSQLFYRYKPIASPKSNFTSNINKNSKLEFVLKILEETIPATGTMAEDYLRSRGYTGRIPEDIRFHNGLRPSGSNICYPTMISVVKRVAGNQIVALHRTYLHEGKKAPIERPKQLLGSSAGGAIRIGTVSNTVVIAEGIETSLSIYLATGLTTWASLSAYGMQNIILPPLDQVSKVIIAADNDQAGLRAADHLSSRLIDNGYKVFIATPSQPMWDFNDLLMGGK